MPAARLLAVLLVQAAAVAPVAGAPAAAMAGAARAAPGAAAPTPGAGLDAPTPQGLQDLLDAFQDSCAVRVYGMYDDVCSDLSDQIRRYRAALARAARQKPPGVRQPRPPTASGTAGAPPRLFEGEPQQGPST